jgi:hypothetical protein
MNERKINSRMSSTWSSGVWTMPKPRAYVIALALLLPGSFVILPLLWLWRRRSAWLTH